MFKPARPGHHWYTLVHGCAVCCGGVMDRAGSKDAATDQRSVRDRMRARAREQTGGERGPYLTPEWLDHSFVLPAKADPGTGAPPSPPGESPLSAPPGP